MTNITFQADDDLKARLKILAKRKGINQSACIKLILKKELDQELGLPLEDAETLNYIRENEPTYGPFDNADDLIKSLKS